LSLAYPLQTRAIFQFFRGLCRFLILESFFSPPQFCQRLSACVSLILFSLFDLTLRLLLVFFQFWDIFLSCSLVGVVPQKLFFLVFWTIQTGRLILFRAADSDFPPSSHSLSIIPQCSSWQRVSYSVSHPFPSSPVVSRISCVFFCISLSFALFSDLPPPRRTIRPFA